MDGICLIDGINIRQYGARIIKDGYNELLTFYSLTPPESVNWPEEDGVEVDLNSPTLSSKEITISFYATDPEGLIALVTKPDYHVFSFPSLKREWKLRVDSQSQNIVWESSSKFSLKFIDDAPKRADKYVSGPGCGIVVPACNYEMDGISWQDYGVIVKKGSRDEVLKSPAVKKNLSQKILTKDGQFYDVDQVVFEAKDVAFNLYMCADNVEKFWQCYDAFFNDLIKPNERLLYVEYTDEEYPCYYKSSSNFKILSLEDQVIVEFKLTLVFTSFRINETEYILASEDNERIVDEEDGETCIDLGIYYD